MVTARASTVDLLSASATATGDVAASRHMISGLFVHRKIMKRRSQKLKRFFRRSLGLQRVSSMPIKGILVFLR
ncbi:hypothetical protein A9Q02_00035 [Candidatus Chloroploca asiatica]|uniref:Uncharacterized protein n=1 Tax=Candidatus Chloroploca asiatica TaxID=1506545 RepID=A0A2H3L8K9_9CHLR|nr:hypothetical protein A9Q02_00035 [Candidatus Chloroploca asiatica]